jgi:cytosine/adenosine deaminase-related metal-dependent hydrolase
VEEQPKEVEDARAAYGRRPLALLNVTLGGADRLTAIHCTQSEPGDLEAYVAAGGGVGTCPITEGNLGDGIPRALPLLHAARRLSLGSDSNARISMLEEMRWLEYGQRLATGTRGVIVARDTHTAPALLDIGTAGGAAALGLEAGRIEAGWWADLAVVDLGHPALAGCDAAALPAALVFCAGNEVIAGTFVGGRFRPSAPR